MEDSLYHLQSSYGNAVLLYSSHQNGNPPSHLLSFLFPPSFPPLLSLREKQRLFYMASDIAMDNFSWYSFVVVTWKDQLHMDYWIWIIEYVKYVLMYLCLKFPSYRFNIRVQLDQRPETELNNSILVCNHASSSWKDSWILTIFFNYDHGQMGLIIRQFYDLIFGRILFLLVFFYI